MKLDKDDFKAFMYCYGLSNTYDNRPCKECIYRKKQDKCDDIVDNGKRYMSSILRMIEHTNETSATKCFETINKIKRGELDDE